MMSDIVAPKNWPRLGTLLLILALQTMLLFYDLDLLRMWGDESFTVKTVQLQPGEIARVLAGDMYPPLYYVLAHYWIQIPWPASVLMKARALSIVFLLLATVAFDRLWLRDFDGGVRIWFLCLWTFSPFLVLYSRMARYYTLQLLLCSLVVHSAVRLIGDPRSKRHLLLYTVTCVLLLYVHYLP